MIKYQKLINRIDRFVKFANRLQDLEILKNNVGNYLHFSDSERFGISYHKDTHPGNPRGLYGFPITPNRIANLENINNLGDWKFYLEGKYIYIFSVNGNILNLENFDMQDIMDRIKEMIMSKYKLSNNDVYYLKFFLLPSAYGKNLLMFIDDIFHLLQRNHLAVNEHSVSNIILRGIGYDAMETKNYGFGDDISKQIVVLNPLAINLISKINNPIIDRRK